MIRGAVAALEEAGFAGRIHSVAGDVRNYSDCAGAVQAAGDKFGKLTVLVNCAAGNFLAPASVLTPGGFKTVFDIDALGTFHCCKAAYEDLLATRGLVVNISMTLHYTATFYQAHACAAKAAVDTLTRNLALEWGYQGIRVNGVAPGPIANTAGMAKLDPKGRAAPDRSGRPEDRMMQDPIPLGRMGEAWDVAMAVLYLVSPGATWVTGHTVVVDGGNMLWRPPVVSPDKVVQVSRAVEAQSRAPEGGMAAAAATPAPPRSRM